LKNTITIGIDLGDRKHQICELDKDGKVIKNCSITNTSVSLGKYFRKHRKSLIAMEVGTHSRWISLLLQEMGHQVLVANARKVRAIWANERKNDRNDAQMLARIARLDPTLLHPIEHRSMKAQADLAVLKARDILVRTRSRLIAHVRGTVKSFGERVNCCSAEGFANRAEQQIPENLRPALKEVIEEINSLTKRIRRYDYQIERMSTQSYSESQRLRQVTGVGAISAMAFVLSIEDPRRFEKSRDVGAYLGLTPRLDQSGNTDKQLPITKCGNGYVRRLLVNNAQYILGPFGKPCQLRDFGERLSRRGGKNAKRKAVVAVARKLGILLHVLWKSDASYNPFYKQTNPELKTA